MQKKYAKKNAYKDIIEIICEKKGYSYIDEGNQELHKHLDIRFEEIAL
ncbi:MAG: hypothetical protein ACLUR5_16875 [Eubacterium ventriosum]